MPVRPHRLIEGGNAVGGLKVAIVGAGRLGTLLATRIPGSCRKVIISQQKAKAVTLADEVGGIASDQLSALRGCQVVFLAVPSSAVAQVVQDAIPHLDEQALVVNTATDLMTDELAARFPKVRLAAAKLIGHAREIAMGSPGVVVLDHVEGEDEERLRMLLAGLGAVTRDRESKILEANAAVVEVMVRAEADLRSRLQAIGLKNELIQAAITTTGPGVLRSLTAGDAGPFVQGVIERLRTGETAASQVSR